MAHLTLRDTAMPDLSRLVAKRIKLEGEYWVYQVVTGIQQQHHTLSIFGTHRKIERLLVFNPGGSERQWKPFCLCPARAFFAFDCREVQHDRFGTSNLTFHG